MTRTERNQHPAALLKDKHSRSGLTKPSEQQRKQGAGAHNWGSFKQEGEYENQAGDDARREEGDGDAEGVFDMEEDVAELPSKQRSDSADSSSNDVAGVNTSANAKGAIATSPADSMASIDSNKSRPAPGGRRMSNVSDEERERARLYRERVMAGGGPDSLANIARTSFGVASPPKGNGFANFGGISPSDYKAEA